MSAIPIIPPGTADKDLITAINDRIRRINEALGGGAAATTAAAATISYGTHKQRLGTPVKNFATGSLWVETDRGVTYQVQFGAWAYLSGAMRATFANRATDLAKGDAGFRWSVTDYSHLLRWTGTGWEFCDDQGGYIAGRTVAPDATGWQICDGTATTYLHISGGTASESAFTTPNLSGTPGYLKMGAAYTGTINAAVAPTTGTPSATVVAGTGATTAGSGTHTHVISLAGGDPVANAVVLPYFRR